MAVLTGGTPLFVLGFIGMWFFAALDSWRTAQMIRSGLTPDIAEDIFVKRFSGNPKLWGIVLTILGGAFLLQGIFPIRGLMRGLVPALLIGLGIYILRDYIFKPKEDNDRMPNFDSVRPAPLFVTAKEDRRYTGDLYAGGSDENAGRGYGNWNQR